MRVGDTAMRRLMIFFVVDDRTHGHLSDHLNIVDAGGYEGKQLVAEQSLQNFLVNYCRNSVLPRLVRKLCR